MKESQLSDGFYGKGVKNVWLFYTADSDEKWPINDGKI